MSHPIRPACRLAVAAVLGALLMISGVAVTASPARADSAPADPASPVTPATVSADGLPTVQINGVVWSQVVVGNTVYAAGSFTRARPAGAPAGTGETVRNNLLAYDIRTGDLITGFAPDLNAQALAVAVSPDGSTLYVGGEFDHANGQARYSMAAYSTATGQLLSNFQPVVGADVRAIAVTKTAVYIGGDNFGVAGGAARNFLAALDPATGAALPWAPVADNAVDALAVVNNGAAVAIGGHLTKLNNASVYGLGAVDATTGQNLPFAASQATTNGGVDSGFTALTTDGSNLYATGYSWNTSGNFEGLLSINPNGGAVNWVDDCRGDSYSVYANGAEEYVAGHAHVCSNIGGFNQVNPNNDLTPHYRAIAFSKKATGTVGNEIGTFTGQPSPSLLNWFPTLDAGTYTGQAQGPWSVAGNSGYVVYGGEFPTVNGVAQQGLVRFAVPSLAPNKVGPASSPGLTPTVASTAAGKVRVSWQGTSDQDNGSLTYDLYRSDKPGLPVYETTASGTFWALPELSFLDRSAPAGKTVTYQVSARDPFGNSVTGGATSVTVATAAGPKQDDYADAIIADGPTDYWRMDEASGTTLADQVGTFDLTSGSGVTLGRSGALTGRSDTAASFSGTSSGVAATRTAVMGPNTFSLEAWFSTTSRTGGLLMGLGNNNSGLSTNYDRHVTIDGSGRVNFGVYNSQYSTVRSAAGYNDGRWHHVVATLGTGGMALYLDGTLVASKADTVTAQTFSGYWKIGGDPTWDGSGPYLAATIDDVAVYPAALTATQVARHRSLGVTAPSANTPPRASFTSAVDGATVSVDGSGSSDAEGPVSSYAWNFGDGSTGTGVTSSHTYTNSGTYTVVLTVTDAGGATGSTSRQVTVTVPTPGAILASDAFGRTVTGGWGTADTGGTWTITGSTANSSVTNGIGQITAAAGTSNGATLGISAADVDLLTDVVLPRSPSGGGSFVTLGTRTSGSTQYETQLWFSSGGAVGLSVLSDVNGTETDLADVTLPGSYTAGTTLRVRTEAVGVGTTALRARAWSAGSPEPVGWQVTAQDATPALQGRGGISVQLYTSKTATSAGTVQVDNLQASVPGAATNTPPAAAFTSSVSGLTVSVDGSSSTDANGSVASFAWNFGDGTTATGVAPAHTYAAAGTYTVTLTVTDNDGATGTATHAVTVTAPAPGAPLASDAFGRTVTAGWGSADVGGTWTLGGSSTSASVSGGTGVLTAAAGTGTVEDLGISAQDVALQADFTLDKAPTGGGTFVNLAGRNVSGNQYNAQLWFAAGGTVVLSLLSENNGTETDLGDYQLIGAYTPGTALSVRLQLSGSTPTTVQAEAWPAGTAAPAAWQVAASDSATALQKSGGLEVQVYQSKSATSAQTVHVDNVWAGTAGTTPSGGAAPTNAAPTAAFTSAVSGAVVSVDGSGSTDPDGTVASYAWNFGDGTTGTGRTATHTYAASGTYNVRLTVTDNGGATGTVSHAVGVTVPAPPPATGALASDGFGRTVTGGWGSADTGGAWSIIGAATGASVGSGTGQLAAAAGSTTGAQLGLSAQDVAFQADVSLDKAPTGGGSWVTLATRAVGWTRYETQLWFSPDGTVVLSLLAQVNGNETDLGDYVLPGTYAAGTVLTVRTDAGGAGTTTLHAKVWAAGTTEPAAWQLSATDGTAGLQGAGAIGVDIYQSKTATSAETLRVDNVWAGASGTKPV